MQTIVRFLGTPAGLALRYAVSLTLIVLIAWRIDWRSLADLVSRLDPALLATAVVLAVLAFPLCALRWQGLLRAADAGLPFGRAHALTWIGQFYNAFLPGGIGGDTSRLLQAFALHPGRKAAIAAATAADRGIGFALLLVLAAAALGLHSLRTAGSVRGAAFLALAAAAALALVAAPWLLPAGLVGRLPPAWQEALAGLRRSPGAVGTAAGLSAAVWLLDFAAGWCLALSLGLPFGPLVLSTALAVAYVSTVLPISLGGHGVREGSLVLALRWLDEGGRAQPDDLAAFALLFLSVNLFSSLLGGAVLLTDRTRSPKRSPR